MARRSTSLSVSSLTTMFVQTAITTDTPTAPPPPSTRATATAHARSEPQGEGRQCPLADPSGPGTCATKALGWRCVTTRVARQGQWECDGASHVAGAAPRDERRATALGSQRFRGNARNAKSGNVCQQCCSNRSDVSMRLETAARRRRKGLGAGGHERTSSPVYHHHHRVTEHTSCNPECSRGASTRAPHEPGGGRDNHCVLARWCMPICSAGRCKARPSRRRWCGAAAGPQGRCGRICLSTRHFSGEPSPDGRPDPFTVSADPGEKGGGVASRDKWWPRTARATTQTPGRAPRTPRASLTCTTPAKTTRERLHM